MIGGVVKALEDGHDASSVEAFVAFVIAFNKVMGVAALDRFSKDGVGVEAVEDEDVAHVTVGGDRKLTWEIRANKNPKVFPPKCIGACFAVTVAMVLW